MKTTEWMKVVFAAECDEDGFCPQCNTDYTECPCPGPTEDEVEYEVRDGNLYGRRLCNESEE